MDELAKEAYVQHREDTTGLRIDVSFENDDTGD